jgi:anhydro-N-acetylmuramic acid kinase
MRVLALSSGTSVDAIDVALADLSDAEGVVHVRLLGHAERPWPDDLRARILAVLPPAKISMGEVCALDTVIGQTFGDVGAWAIRQWGAVDLVVSHGQTVFHWVEGDTARGTLQIGAAAWIAERTGRPVVSDLRSSDVAFGGHGAPLTSLLDHLWLSEQPSAVVNIGGIANVSIVGVGPVHTGDTGPGNCLIDVAVAAHNGAAFDDNGALARSGTVNEAALAALMSDPYYAREFPKSTGRELFDAGYVTEFLAAATPETPTLRGTDLIATLTELTARTIAAQVGPYGVGRVVVSGGGTRNSTLMRRLDELLPGVMTSDALGLPSEAKEAYLFALLGYLAVRGLPGTAPGLRGLQATGARSAVVLGSLTPPAPAPCPPATTPVQSLVVSSEKRTK